jgi:hypothetical protein
MPMQVFESFQATPIAAASLGQVHLAELGGQKVRSQACSWGLMGLVEA